MSVLPSRLFAHEADSRKSNHKCANCFWYLLRFYSFTLFILAKNLLIMWLLIRRVPVSWPVTFGIATESRVLNGSALAHVQKARNQGKTYWNKVNQTGRIQTECRGKSIWCHVTSGLKTKKNYWGKLKLRDLVTGRHLVGVSLFKHAGCNRERRRFAMCHCILHRRLLERLG